MDIRNVPLHGPVLRVAGSMPDVCIYGLGVFIRLGGYEWVIGEQVFSEQCFSEQGLVESVCVD
jgi:hypothetical protein